MQESFHQYIRKRRISLQVSQPDLAEKICVARSWISRIEKDCVPSDAIIADLAEALNINETDLFLRADKIPMKLREIIIDNTLAKEVIHALSEQRLSDEVYRQILALLHPEEALENQ